MATEEAESTVEMVGVLRLTGTGGAGGGGVGTVGTGGVGGVGAVGDGGVVEPLGLSVVSSGEGVESLARTVIGSAAQPLVAVLSLLAPEYEATKE
jgi:hypothetical protein